MSQQRDGKGRFIKGNQGGPGVPLKSLNLTALLRAAGEEDNRAAWLALNLWTLATQGGLTLQSGKQLAINSAKEWFALASWIFERLEGKPIQPVSFDATDPPPVFKSADFKQAVKELQEWKAGRGEQ